MTKKGWLPFFEVYFIDPPTALLLMPLVGALDMVVGILAFVYPTRLLLLWTSGWTLFTAMLRPSAGMGMSEFFERAGNFGVPLLFLFLYKIPAAHDTRQWLTRLNRLPCLTLTQGQLLEHLMRFSLVSLLVGHGGLCLFVKHPLIARNLGMLGVTDEYGLQWIGAFEIALGCLVCLKPRLSGLLPFVFGYKLASELLFPMAGSPIDIFETIERMGSYVIPLILIQYYSSPYADREPSIPDKSMYTAH